MRLQNELRFEGADVLVVACKVADCNATAGTRGRASGHNSEVTTRVVGDGEISRLLSNNAGNYVQLGVGGGAAIARGGGDAPIVGGGCEGYRKREEGEN